MIIGLLVHFLSVSSFEEKQQKLQLELRDFSRSVPFDLNSSDIAAALKDYRQAVEEFQCKEQLSDEKIRLLEDQLSKSKAEEKAQRLKCLFLTKQMKKLSSKTKYNTSSERLKCLLQSFDREKREDLDDQSKREKEFFSASRHGSLSVVLASAKKTRIRRNLSVKSFYVSSRLNLSYL